MKKKERVEVVVEIYQGIVNSVNVFKSDKTATAEEKALDWLNKNVSDSIVSVKTFTVKKATSGGLYPILYTGEPKTPMVIDMDNSFACEKSKLLFIN